MESEFFAEGFEITTDEDMVHVAFLIGTPPRVQARLHMPRRRWWTMIKTVYEAGKGRPDGTKP